MTRFNSQNEHTAKPEPVSSLMRRRPQRVSITVNWALYQRLLVRSDREGRSLSNLAAHLLELACSESLGEARG